VAYDRKAEAARKQGLLPRDQLKDLAPGAVWWAQDEFVQLPEERVETGDREIHARRPVVVFQSLHLCAASRPVTVLIAPCSTKTDRAGAGDLMLLETGPFDAKTVVVYLTLLQPLLKRELVKFMGHLPHDKFRMLQAQLAQNLALAQDRRLAVPPRPPSEEQ
jgi:mRNA-degrading endonuclease toxin of MazEF toxin-antitoxin module